MLRCNDAQRKTYDKGEDKGHERKPEGDAHALRNHIRDGQLRAGRGAKAAAQDPLDEP